MGRKGNAWLARLLLTLMIFAGFNFLGGNYAQAQGAAPYIDYICFDGSRPIYIKDEIPDEIETVSISATGVNILVNSLSMKNADETYIANIYSGDDKDNINKVVEENLNIVGGNKKQINIISMLEWKGNEAAGIKGMELGEAVYVRIDTAPENPSDSGKMDETRKQTYLFKVVKGVGIKHNSSIQLKDADNKKVNVILPGSLKFLYNSGGIKGAYPNFWGIKKMDGILKINVQGNETVKQGEEAKLRFRIGDKIFLSNEEVTVNLDELPVIDDAKTIKLEAYHTEKPNIGTEYIFKIYQKDYTPTVELISSEKITCNKGDEVYLEVKAEAPNGGELKYGWRSEKIKEGKDKSRCKLNTDYAFNKSEISCLVYILKDGCQFFQNSDDIEVEVLPTYNSGFEFSHQPLDTTSVIDEGKPKLEIEGQAKDQGSETSYQWYVNDTKTYDNGTKVDGATKNVYYFPNNELGTKYYYCEATTKLKLVDGEINTKIVNSDIATVNIIKKEMMLEGFDGYGTEDAPYLIKTAEDIIKLRDLVNAGNSFNERIFKITGDIDLPENWEPIGCTKDGSNDIEKGENLNAFGGTLDGDNNKLTVPKGGLPLFGYVRGGTIKNIKIYGEEIAGFGLINYFHGVGLSGKAVLIDNVTLLKGTKTLKSGFLGGEITTNGFAGVSAGYEATIQNCTIEKDVIIGYSGEERFVGSFAGRMQGTVSNCVSYATVKGSDYVGGIIGSRDNAMGNCIVKNCRFSGEVIGTGECAGGIVGGGYENSTAPNGIKVSVLACTADGSIKGKESVGGILGGDLYVAQAWNPYSFIGNVFKGKVEGEKNVGAIIGYYDSLNKLDNVANNFFAKGCGADKGIGVVKYIDTNYKSPTHAPEAVYFSTEKDSSGAPYVEGCGWRIGFNRTDDPLGKHKERLTKQTDNIPDKICYELTLEGKIKDKYYIGEELDFSDMIFTAKWSDGTETNPVYGNGENDVKATGFDNKINSVQEVVLHCGDATASIQVAVLKKPAEDPAANNVTATFTLLGTEKTNSSEVPEEGKAHTLREGNLDVWIEKITYTMPLNSTAGDLFKKALADKGIKWKGTDKNQYNTLYISGVQIPGTEEYLSEFDNGKNSGWMYTVNGHHPEVGVDAYFLNNGDNMIFHYTEDYTKEEGSEKWNNEAANSAEVMTAKVGNGEITTVKTDISTGSETGADGSSISTATVTVKDENAAEMVKQAKEMKSSEIVLDAKVEEAAADTVRIELPKKVAENILADTKADLTVKLPEAEVKLSQTALKEIASQAKGDKLTVEVAKIKNPTDEQKKSAGKSAEVFGLTVKSGDNVIHSFGAGKVNVRKLIPERLKEKKIAAIYIPEKGDIEVMSGKKVAVDKKDFYEFTTSHFSDFALVDAEEVGIEVGEAMTSDEVKAVVKELRLKATTKALKKSIRVTVKADKEALMKLKESGYEVKYKYYRAVKKSGRYKLIATKKADRFTNTKVTKGKTYYYKARLAVYDGEDKQIAITSLKNCNASKRQLKKAA